MQAEENFKSFLESFDKACASAGRKKEEIKILPVSKGKRAEFIKEFLALEGFPQELAENYVGELEEKHAELPNVRWHYQGALQSRKIDEVLKFASVIQSVSRSKEIEALFSGNQKKNVEFFIQVNISAESQKLGASHDEVKEMLALVSKLNIAKNFVGFMGVASELSSTVQESDVRRQFASLRLFRDRIFPSAKLSMGMSADFHLALAEGADIIRVGSSIFGSRR
jgi:pyridoxal phosphate enzyme (YggS family)